ncbi:MAG: thiamine pyrophosphate-binding protein [Pseudomonadota bacterium]
MYDRLAKLFAQKEVGVCFALLGDANMMFATRLGEEGVQIVTVRHEHCAAAAAMAYARKTGDVGLATVTCGPGLTQLMTALPAAVRAKIPLVVFAGEAPQKAAWYNQAIDQAPLVTATGARYLPLRHPNRIIPGVNEAFLTAREERVPVVVGVPFDLQAEPFHAPPYKFKPQTGRPTPLGPMPPNPDDVEALTWHLAGHDRIILLAGLGAAGAADACRTLAERLGALTATTLPARGLFHDDPHCLGLAGGFSTTFAHARFEEANVVLAIGASLSQHTRDGDTLFPQALICQITTAPQEVVQGSVAANIIVRGDARLTVEALLAALPQQSGWRTPEMASAIKTHPIDDTPKATDALDPRDVIAAFDAALPPEWEMVNSSGHSSYYAAHMPLRPFARFLTIREFGAIGNGLSFAIGVALARPDTPVVLFDGDGSLMMHIQEFETVRRLGLNILIVVLNDGAYGSEIHKLRAKGFSDEHAVFGRTDFAAIARGFGLSGERIDDCAAIPEAIARYAEAGGGAVLDVAISDKVMSPLVQRHSRMH